MLQTDSIIYCCCPQVRQWVMVPVRPSTHTHCTVVAPDTKKRELSQIMSCATTTPKKLGMVSILCGCCVYFVACVGSPVTLVFIRLFSSLDNQASIRSGFQPLPSTSPLCLCCRRRRWCGVFDKKIHGKKRSFKVLMGGRMVRTRPVRAHYCCHIILVRRKWSC